MQRIRLVLVSRWKRSPDSVVRRDLRRSNVEKRLPIKDQARDGVRIFGCWI